MPEGSLKLGKLPAQPKPMDFRLVEFLEPTFQFPSPMPTRWGHGSLFANWEMYGNGPDDSVHPGFGGAGDCVFAAMAHVIKMEAHLHRRKVNITGKQVIEGYSAVTGYVLDDESTDNGTYMNEAMSFWRKEGLRDADGKIHKCAAYLSFNARDLEEHRKAAYVLGFALIGFDFPHSAWSQFSEGKPWVAVEGSPSEGGHCVPEVGQSRRNEITTVTWGKRQEMMRDFLESRNDEAWAVVFPGALNTRGVTERGLNIDKLNDALNSLK